MKWSVVGALALAGFGYTTVARAQGIDKAKVTPCPYTAAQITAALGIPVLEGKPAETPFQGGRTTTCTYDHGAGSITSVSVLQTWIDPENLAAKLANMDRADAARAEPIPSDPDHATWLVDKAYPNSLPVLQYTRQNVRTEIHLIGGRFEPAIVRPKILKLKRVP